jgi:hypothetical protein
MTDEIFGPLFPIARFSEIEDVVQFCRKLPTGKPLALYLYRSLRLRTLPRRPGAGTGLAPATSAPGPTASRVCRAGRGGPHPSNSALCVHR